MLKSHSLVPALAPQAAGSPIRIIDDLLPADEQRAVQAFLREGGWSYGAYSSDELGASRYWYKHFAGYFKDGREARTPEGIEQELRDSAPVVWALWDRLRGSVLAGHALTRCYANAYPVGSEGGLHADSNEPNHFTVIYYPHLKWSPNWAGETVFFNADGTDINAAAYPKPNRIVVFPGRIPHVARAASRTCPELRVTLMFKTAVIR
jgi:SM-20-related protein